MWSYTENRETSLSKTLGYNEISINSTDTGYSSVDQVVVGLAATSASSVISNDKPSNSGDHHHGHKEQQATYEQSLDSFGSSCGSSSDAERMKSSGEVMSSENEDESTIEEPTAIKCIECLNRDYDSIESTSEEVSEIQSNEFNKLNNGWFFVILFRFFF